MKKLYRFLLAVGIVLGCFHVKVDAAEYYTITFISENKYIYADYTTHTSPYSIQVAAGDKINKTVEALDDGSSRKFAGWSTPSEGDRIIGEYDIMYYTPKSSMTFTAVFKDTYKVTLNMGEGYYPVPSSHVHDFYVFQGDCFGTLSPIPGYPDNRKVFTAWSTEPYGDIDLGKYLHSFVPESDIVLYANYQDACTVTVEANGGCYFYEPERTEERGLVPLGQPLKNEFPDPVNMDTGKALAGYAYSPTGEPVIANMADYVPTSSVTLYAIWKDAYVLTLNGGENGYFDYNREHVKNYPASVIKNTPVGIAYRPKDGGWNLAFAGWSYTKGGEVDLSPEEVAQLVITEPLTLYAVYVEGYHVLLRSIDDGLMDGAVEVSLWIPENTPIGRNYYVEPYFEKNIFIGWSDTPEGEVIIGPDDLSSAIFTDKTTILYAQFQGPQPAEGVWRISGSGRFQTSMKIADAYKEEKGIDQFENIILTSGLNFADALAGSYLSYKKNAPILITADSFGDSKPYEEVNAYIKANLKKGGTVYVLGGTGAVSETALTGLDGYEIRRLSGRGRFETNIEILKEAGVKDEEILVATGFNFADSLSASAVNRPILLVDKAGLNTDQMTYLDTLESKNYYILGGTGAVSENVEEQLKKYGEVERLSGKGRHETSVKIAEKFCENAEETVLAYSFNFPDGLCAGPLASAVNGPLILTARDDYGAAAQFCNTNEISTGYVIGGKGLINDTAARKIWKLIKNALITKK